MKKRRADVSNTELAPTQVLWEINEDLEYKPETPEGGAAQHMIEDELDERGVSTAARAVPAGVSADEMVETFSRHLNRGLALRAAWQRTADEMGLAPGSGCPAPIQQRMAERFPAILKTAKVGGKRAEGKAEAREAGQRTAFDEGKIKRDDSGQFTSGGGGGGKSEKPAKDKAPEGGKRPEWADEADAKQAEEIASFTPKVEKALEQIKKNPKAVEKALLKLRDAQPQTGVEWGKPETGDFAHVLDEVLFNDGDPVAALEGWLAGQGGGEDGTSENSQDDNEVTEDGGEAPDSGYQYSSETGGDAADFEVDQPVKIGNIAGVEDLMDEYQGIEGKEGVVTGTTEDGDIEVDVDGKLLILDPTELYPSKGTFNKAQTEMFAEGRRRRGGSDYTPRYVVDMSGSMMPMEWNSRDLGRPTQENLEKFVMMYAKSLEAGGVNEHISNGLGYVPYPTWANIRNQETGETMAEWQAGAFQTYGRRRMADGHINQDRAKHGIEDHVVYAPDGGRSGLAVDGEVTAIGEDGYTVTPEDGQPVIAPMEDESDITSLSGRRIALAPGDRALWTGVNGVSSDYQHEVTVVDASDPTRVVVEWAADEIDAEIEGVEVGTMLDTYVDTTTGRDTITKLGFLQMAPSNVKDEGAWDKAKQHMEDSYGSPDGGDLDKDSFYAAVNQNYQDMGGEFTSESGRACSLCGSVAPCRCPSWTRQAGSFHVYNARSTAGSIQERADAVWALMDENEKTMLKIGMSPFWSTQVDLGGKAGGWPAIQGDEHRQLAVALMDLMNQKGGGMIARRRTAHVNDANGNEVHVGDHVRAVQYPDGDVGEVVSIEPIMPEDLADPVQPVSVSVNWFGLGSHPEYSDDLIVTSDPVSFSELTGEEQHEHNMSLLDQLGPAYYSKREPSGLQPNAVDYLRHVAFLDEDEEKEDDSDIVEAMGSMFDEPGGGDYRHADELGAVNWQGNASGRV